MPQYILALDQGTTSSRALLFDAAGEVAALAQQEFRQNYPRPGWVEHDAREIWSAQYAVARRALEHAGVDVKSVAAIAITNQRETTVLWDRFTGEPIAPAIVWQDRRTAERVEALEAQGLGPLVSGKTGLRLDAYFSATKIEWLLDHVSGARQRAEKGEILFGTMDSWLIWNLTRGAEHVTDTTNASRTLLCDLRSGQWDDELLDIFRIPRAMLPRIEPSSGVVAWKLGCAPTQYALEGSVFIAGAVVQWLRDQMDFIESASEIEALAREVPDSGGVWFVPAFVGLGAPYWDPDARGMLIGLTRGTNRAHIARAALEAIAFQSAEVLTAMAKDATRPVRELRVDGGAARNDLLMQMQADIAGVPVIRPAQTETTALGAAFLAGLASGFWQSTDEIASLWRAERVFEPVMNEDQRGFLMNQWARAVGRARKWNQ